VTSDGFPLAAALAARLDVVESTGSTNADLVAAAGWDADAYPHLSVLVTRDQRAGRGRLDRAWTAPAGAALAISVLVRVSRVPVQRRGWVSLAAGAAMTHAVGAQLDLAAVDGAAGVTEPSTVALKWPNDVLIGGAKVCGVLAQVVPDDADAIVIGAGVNTRMTYEQLPVPTATSLAVAGINVDEDALLAEYLADLDRMLRALESDAATEGVHESVRALCGTLGRRVRVTLPGEQFLEGVARDIDDSGRLIVAVDGESVPVAAGDVIHVR